MPLSTIHGQPVQWPRQVVVYIRCPSAVSYVCLQRLREAQRMHYVTQYVTRVSALRRQAVQDISHTLRRARARMRRFATNATRKPTKAP